VLHHHGHHRQLTEAEREQLLSEGTVTYGLVLHNEPAETDRRISRVRITVRFKDGQTVEFTEELANLYQPDPGSPDTWRLAQAREAEQLRHPDSIPKVQLPLSEGESVAVRYEVADRSRVVIDVPALRKRALRDYIQREHKPKGQPPARHGVQTGPPWVVPTHCPNCGAPVDQAVASRQRDPHCEFCHEPVAVTPAGA